MTFHNGKYYFYISHGAFRCWETNPLYGPFHDALDGKLLIHPDDTNYSGLRRESIAPTVFINDNEQAYTYWGNNALYAVKFNQNMIHYSDIIKVFEIKDQIAFSSDYEEAPWIFKHKNRYYLLYATHCPEHIYWVWTDAPLGHENMEAVSCGHLNMGHGEPPRHSGIQETMVFFLHGRRPDKSSFPSSDRKWRSI